MLNITEQTLEDIWRQDKMKEKSFLVMKTTSITFRSIAQNTAIIIHSFTSDFHSLSGENCFRMLTFQSLPVTWCTRSLTFNNCTLCPRCIYVFCIYLRTNSDLYHLQHKLIGFYNRDKKCLLCGTNWVFK